MDDVTICDVRAWDIRVKKIWKTWFLDMGAFSWQNATYTIQFILTIYIKSEKLMLPGRMCACWIFQLKVRNIEKNSKKWLPALFWPFRTSLFSALSWNKRSHIKVPNLKMFKTAKAMFYKQFEFFANWQGRLNLFLWAVLAKHFVSPKKPHLPDSNFGIIK